MTCAALIVAAGRGTRASRADGRPKQYVAIGGTTVLGLTLSRFLGAVDLIQVVIHPDDRADYDAVLARLHETGAAGHDAAPAKAVILPPVAGGATRQASVRAGLEALAEMPEADRPDTVLIHDAARPFVTGTEIRAVIAALGSNPGAILAHPVADTLKRADQAGHIAETVSRDGLWRAQTPQGFHFAPILDAHRAIAEAGTTDVTDDAAVAERAGLAVTLVPGSARNIKLTTAEDLDMAEEALARSGPPTNAQPAYEPRVGTGFDVHRFTAGDRVWLCGVAIPHTHALEGHSDADVGLHALTDALLGAIGDGDIGQHFPPSDPQWKGAASHIFLAHAARRVADRGGRIANVDVTLLCEAPRVGPHRDAMRARIAEILALDIGRVGVKATTTEGLGFTGRREGIAAMANASVLLPV